MKPAARDQDIPRGAGIGGSGPRGRGRRREEPTEPGERQEERDSERTTAATPLLASPVPRPQAPAATPPVPASPRPTPRPTPSKSLCSKHSARQLPGSRLLLLPQSPTPAPAFLSSSLSSFPPSFALGRALLRQLCGCGCAALGPAPYPSRSASTRTPPRTLLGNQRLRPLLPFG